jgi:hypothetical protein
VEKLAESLLDDEGTGFPDTRALSEQLAELDQLIVVHERAFQIATRQLDEATSEASYEICTATRLACKEPIAKILAGLKLVCEGNKELRKIRDDLESQGVKVGYLPLANYSRVDGWDGDADGFGIVAGYRREIEKEFGIKS